MLIATVWSFHQQEALVRLYAHSVSVHGQLVKREREGLSVRQLFFRPGQFDGSWFTPWPLAPYFSRTRERNGAIERP